MSLSLFSVGYYGGLRWLTSNLERAPADEQPTIGERYRARAQHVPWMLLWSNEIVGVVFVLFGISLAATGWRGQPTWMGLAIAATGGLLAWMCGYMLWAKWAKNTRRA